MGTLYLVATPIGNLEDITLRALRVLREVSLIACEDTRHSGRLLKHFGIEKPLVSYHQHNRSARRDEILAALETGDVALISDAGMPAISDPGYELVRTATDRGLAVVAIPGASALVTAVPLSALVPNGFLFAGFPPRRGRERQQFFTRLAEIPYPIVLYEAPHRLLDTLSDLLACLGDRSVAVCRELTKLHEEVVRLSLSQAQEHFALRSPRGELVLVVAGPDSEKSVQIVNLDDLRDLINERLADGLSASAAAREVAGLTGRPRSELYRLAVSLRSALDEPGDDSGDTVR